MKRIVQLVLHPESIVLAQGPDPGQDPRQHRVATPVIEWLYTRTTLRERLNRASEIALNMTLVRTKVCHLPACTLMKRGTVIMTHPNSYIRAPSSEHA